MAPWLRISTLAGAMLLGSIAGTSLGQWSSVTYDPATGEQYPLYQMTTRGMFGVREYGVPLERHNEYPRFPTNGIRYGPSGQILGLDRSAPNSMFKPYVLPQAGFDAREYYPEPGRTTIAPRQQVPVQPQNPRFAQGSPVPESELLTGERLRPEQFQRPGMTAEAAGRQPSASEQNRSEEIWFRGPPPEGSESPSERRNTPSDAFYGAGMMGGGRAASGATLRGRTQGVAQMTSSANVPGNTPQTYYFQPQEQNRTERIEEQLELSLLQSPSVNLQSPVRVTLQNGIATVRGIVPTPQHRMQAGRLLLSNPAVNQVNNLMVPLSDRTTPPEPVELNPVTPESSETNAPRNSASDGNGGNIPAESPPRANGTSE